MFPAIEEYIATALPLLEGIPDQRKALLDRIAGYVSQRLESGEIAKLIFICTHNSRRSHMAQLWAQVTASYCGIDRYEFFSAGTSATAFHPSAVGAMRKAGFQIDPASENGNPKYAVSYSASASSIISYSKSLDDPSLPRTGFGAVMTCSHADEACPMVIGADFRQSIPYDDPKSADGTPEEEATYDARCRQIASEMLYLFGKVERKFDEK